MVRPTWCTLSRTIVAVLGSEGGALAVLWLLLVLQCGYSQYSVESPEVSAASTLPGCILCFKTDLCQARVLIDLRCPAPLHDAPQ